MLSLRHKLTLYYIAILAVILLIFGVAIYAYLSRSLVMTIDESLDVQVKKLEKAVKLTTSNLPLDEQEAQAENTDDHLATVETFQLTPQLLEVINQQGEIKTESYAHPSDKLPFNLATLLDFPLNTTIYQTVRTNTGEPLRLATRRAKGYDNEDFFVRLGQSLASLERARKRLLIVLSLALPLALLLGSYGGLLLANQALQPVDEITRTAGHISANDLTERVPVPATTDEIGRLARTFNQMITRLQDAFNRQKQFTSDASHELRTPLAVMRGEIEITLRRERAVAEYQRVLGSNLEEIVRLSRLVEDLLMLARADAGRIELSCAPFDLAELCQDMATYITPLAEQRAQTLLCKVPDTPVTINADLQRIKQLLLNLLDNAIKYTDINGQITLQLAVENQISIITINDTGRGIPAEDLPHIYERFFRRSASTSDRSAAGTGLGLSIVKWIVDAHAGKIVAQSELGKGTTFTVQLPLQV